MELRPMTEPERVSIPYKGKEVMTGETIFRHPDVSIPYKGKEVALILATFVGCTYTVSIPYKGKEVKSIATLVATLISFNSI